MSTIDIYMQHETRSTSIKSRREDYERRLMTLKEPSQEQVKELTTLRDLLQVAEDYQDQMQSRLLTSRSKKQEEIADFNKQLGKEQKEGAYQKSLESFDHIYLEQLRSINAQPNPIEKRVQQLEKAYERRRLISEQQRKIEEDIRAFQLQHPSTNNRAAALPPKLAEALDSIQKASTRNVRLISLLSEDARKKTLPFNKTSKIEVQEKERDNEIIKNEVLAQAHYLESLWLPKTYSKEEAESAHEFALFRLSPLFDALDTNYKYPDPYPESYFAYTLRAAELEEQGAIALNARRSSYNSLKNSSSVNGVIPFTFKFSL